MWLIKNGLIRHPLITHLPDTGVTPPPSFAPSGLSLQQVFYDRLRMTATLRAAQATEKMHILEAGQVATLSGARANMFMGRVLAFIQEYEISDSGLSGSSDWYIIHWPVGRREAFSLC